MQIYLPIADLPVNLFLILGIGAAVGFVSGMFGVGGGFLLTPLLIFLGINPGVAVASTTGHIAASSFSGTLAYWRKRALDPLLAFVLFVGGAVGTLGGVAVFTMLRSYGQLDVTIALSYVVLLSGVGGAMFWESIVAILRARDGETAAVRLGHRHSWIHDLPFKVRFKRSKVFISLLPVVVIGVCIGFVGAILGVGGGFILVPILVYMLRIPTSVVIGTSSAVTLATMTLALIVHATTNHLVDALLALILMVGGAIGAQFGARAAQRLSGETLRLLLALVILGVAVRFSLELAIRPTEQFVLRPVE